MLPFFEHLTFCEKSKIPDYCATLNKDDLGFLRGNAASRQLEGRIAEFYRRVLQY
jgi:hypothetical protein